MKYAIQWTNKQNPQKTGIGQIRFPTRTQASHRCRQLNKAFSNKNEYKVIEANP